MTDLRDHPGAGQPGLSPFRDDLTDAGRQLATLTLVGGLLGILVVGVLGRLAMSLLAFLNPDAAGLTSDDGFTIGQFTLVGSLQLVGSGLQFGVTGAFLYAVVRGLIVGPPWFRLTSISLGPAVVIAAILVEPHGVDFTRLHPVGLSIALFIALPAIFVAGLHLGAEKYLARSGDLPRPLVGLGLAPWVLLLPATLLLLAGWAALRAVRRTTPGRRVLEHPATGWVPRAGLAGIFALSVVNLAADVVALT